VNPKLLLFAGTEHGLYFTTRRKEMGRLTGDFRRSPVRDIAIQERESDLVTARFGRGF